MTNNKPWKKNLRKIPPQIQAKVENFDVDTCVAACVIQVGFEDIEKGMFGHLGILSDHDGLQFPPQKIPPREMGIYSRRNQEGQELVHKDQPKTSKSWSINVPNYGDWLNGNHDIVFSKEVYQREFIAPKLVPITIDYLGEDIRQQAYIFKFTVDEILCRKDEDFAAQLLFNLNLLQENTGNHDVFTTNESLEEYLSTLYVNWEILPVGEKKKAVNRILSGDNSSDPKIREMVTDRYDFLHSLKPKHLIKGTNEFRRYFGAQFADDLVVFENIEYGNAIYIMFDDWKELSKMTRTELLSSKTHHFERIPHTKTWKRRLRNLVLEELYSRRVTQQPDSQTVLPES